MPRSEVTLEDARQIGRWVFEAQYVQTIVVELRRRKDSRRQGALVSAGRKSDAAGYLPKLGDWTREADPVRISRTTVDPQNNSVLTRVSASNWGSFGSHGLGCWFQREFQVGERSYFPLLFIRNPS